MTFDVLYVRPKTDRLGNQELHQLILFSLHLAKPVDRRQSFISLLSPSITHNELVIPSSSFANSKSSAYIFSCSLSIERNDCQDSWPPLAKKYSGTNNLDKPNKLANMWAYPQIMWKS